MDSTQGTNFPFSDQIALLDKFLSYRAEIVERIEESLLNVRGKDAFSSRDRGHFDRTLNECFLSAPSITPGMSGLQGLLKASHLADGFEPINLGAFSNEFDSLDLIIRAYEYWDTHRWPGKSGRLAYAQSVYSAFMLRQFEYLSLRVWDDGDTCAGDRLQEIQHLLDRLNTPSAHQVYVRDVRWLVQTAQGALTKYLEPYFRIATHISTSFTESTRLGLHVAGAKLAGGHLRSQLRYRALENNLPIDGPVNWATARNSNSMDCALLIRDLVPLLKAYEKTCAAEDNKARMEFADAILQGLSADPELLLTRLDLLGPYTMIEDLFLERGEDGRVRYTPLGQAHLAVLDQYRELVGRLAELLKSDAAALAPSLDSYSPYGISYGFVADVLSNAAMDTLVLRTSSNLSLEDMFDSQGSLEAKLARSRAWAELPKREGERDHFYHSAAFAAQNFTRLMAALGARVLRKNDLNASNHPDARIFVFTEGKPIEKLPSDALPAGIARAEDYCYREDPSRALSGSMTHVPREQIVIDRNEGRFLASAETGGEWFAVSKVIVTLFTSQGKDALISGVPGEVIELLCLTCPALIALSAADDAREQAKA